MTSGAGKFDTEIFPGDPNAPRDDGGSVPLTNIAPGEIARSAIMMELGVANPVALTLKLEAGKVQIALVVNAGPGLALDACVQFPCEFFTLVNAVLVVASYPI